MQAGGCGHVCPIGAESSSPKPATIGFCQEQRTALTICPKYVGPKSGSHDKDFFSIGTEECVRHPRVDAAVDGFASTVDPPDRSRIASSHDNLLAVGAESS